MSSVPSGDELVIKGDKKGSGWFANHEEAAEYYTSAATAYKVSKDWEKAAKAYIKAAGEYMKIGNKSDAATSYTDAAGAYRKVNNAEAIVALQSSMNLNTELARVGTAARLAKEIAEIYESENDLKQAVSFYKVAAENYADDNSSASANRCKIKVALYSAQLEDYDTAIKLFEEVGQACLDNQLTQYSAKDYFLQAFICYLCHDDNVGAGAALKRFTDLYVAFADTREYKFAAKILQTVNDKDMTEFTAAVKDYDSLRRLDSWMTTMLLRIKNRLKAADKPEM